MGEVETKLAPGGSDGPEGLYLGDAIHFFLSAKRAGGRSERTVDDYRKKLELFQRWLAKRIGGEYAVDAPYASIGADEVEAYVVYLRDVRGMEPYNNRVRLIIRDRRSSFLWGAGGIKVPTPAPARYNSLRLKDAEHKRIPQMGYLCMPGGHF